MRRCGPVASCCLCLSPPRVTPCDSRHPFPVPPPPATEYCCNGTVIEDEELGKVLQLQGDQRKVRMRRCHGEPAPGLWLVGHLHRCACSSHACCRLCALPASAGRKCCCCLPGSKAWSQPSHSAPSPTCTTERVGLPAGQPAVQEGPGQGARLLSSPAPLRPHRPGCLSGSWLARPPWPPTPPGGPCGRAATLRLGSALACAGWRRQQRWQEWRPEC